MWPILYFTQKIHSEYIFELIFSYEKKKVKIWDIDFSVDLEVVALVKRGSKWMNKECCTHTNCLVSKENLKHPQKYNQAYCKPS